MQILLSEAKSLLALYPSGIPRRDPPAVKILENRLSIYLFTITHLSQQVEGIAFTYSS